MKRIGTLGYLILGLITTSAFAQTSSTVTATSSESVQAAPSGKSGKHKKGSKKHSHHGKHTDKKKSGSENEQK